MSRPKKPLPPRAVPSTITPGKHVIKLTDAEKNLLIMVGDVNFQVHRHVKCKAFGRHIAARSARDMAISQATALIKMLKGDL